MIRFLTDVILVQVLLAGVQIPFTRGKGEQPSGLLVELLNSPALGVSTTPSFSWIVPHVEACNSTVSGQVQTHYQIQVFDTLSSLVLDTAKLPGTSSVNVVPNYTSRVFEAGEMYTWRVKAWTSPLTTNSVQDGSCTTLWSENATFVVGLSNGFSQFSVPIWTEGANFAFFEKSYQNCAYESDILAAVVFVTAVGDEKLLGSYRLFVNGRTVSIGPG